MPGCPRGPYYLIRGEDFFHLRALGARSGSCVIYMRYGDDASESRALDFHTDYALAD